MSYTDAQRAGLARQMAQPGFAEQLAAYNAKLGRK
jgi:hypothetical protein